MQNKKERVFLLISLRKGVLVVQKQYLCAKNKHGKMELNFRRGGPAKMDQTKLFNTKMHVRKNNLIL